MSKMLKQIILNFKLIVFVALQNSFSAIEVGYEYG